MVFKPLNLARQSFLKTFTHGYAQSLVAASQSSSASQNTSFLGNGVANLLHTKSASSNHASSTLQPPQSASSLSAKVAQQSELGGTSDGGLAAYYAAWQRHRKGEDKDLHPFHFAKRIGWKAPTTIPDSIPKGKDTVKSADEVEDAPRRRPTIGRSYSASAADAIKRTSPETLVESQPLGLGPGSAIDDTPLASDTARVSAQNLTRGATSTAAPTHDAANSRRASDVFTPSPTQSTRATSVSESDPYTDHLSRLAERQQYAEIPALFEHMLREGVKPSPSSYNALLLAAINIPRGKHQVASKVLDVYSDMLHRRVLPDTSTYAIIVELLAARAVDVIAMKKDLGVRRVRYGGMGGQEGSMLRSDEMESKILAEDESLSTAITLFDTSAAVAVNHILPTETYRLLITACAETGRISDMVRIYASMESQNVTPPTSIFAPMIQAFASRGDLKSAVECYNEYKSLAVGHDQGGESIVRKDEEVYAAVIRAYSTCDRLEGGLKFLGRIEDSLELSERLPPVRDTVALESLHPIWLRENRHEDAISHAIERLSPEGCVKALSAICVDAADKDNAPMALEAFGALLGQEDRGSITEATTAMLSMHVRQGDVEAALNVWENVKIENPSIAFVEPSAMLALALIGSSSAEHGLIECRQMFSRIREATQNAAEKAESVDRIDEAIELVSGALLNSTPMPSTAASLQLIHTMVENSSLVSSIAERLLAAIGPDQLSLLSLSDLTMLLQVQAGLLTNRASLDVAHGARFLHLFELVTANGSPIDGSTSKIVQDALTRLNRLDLLVKIQSPQRVAQATPFMTSTPAVPYSPAPAAFEDSYDPYGSSTDFKGSTAIAEELEKTHGRFSSHLNEALTRFRNMRRTGRHPRYVTYAKLIAAAAKDHQLTAAEDILGTARQDVPLIPHSKVVNHGWVTILDSMVGACLNLGRRDLAARYHQDLLNIGASPSANTFGLYITTLKESTKTFDEASEAVKIFHQAKTEGVEPTSFLYNALIGKLGKARRIDDCMFYFTEMRQLGIRPTSVTYGTVVNALCRVSDEKLGEEIFDEMESASNYKPRPAPYNSLMQYFLTTKRDRSKVLSYYARMKNNNIRPTMHTYKLLIDTHATLEPVDLTAAESVIEEIRRSGANPEPVHYASMIHAKGCVLHDMSGAREIFDKVVDDHRIPAHPSPFQALFESYVANHDVAATEPLLQTMKTKGIGMTPYIANTLIHGWAAAQNIDKAREIFERLGRDKREPSTYEAMTRAHLAVEDHGNAKKIVGEALRRGYPSAVANKIVELVGGYA
ncbi:MAG: hypothetical protein M1831_001662 [Alyxoria varia]|nr:MAG: hypothetical protein M1831_001662 [Alyxoria varia]